VKYFILNLSDGDRERAASFLRTKMWALEREERHCSALAPGDLALIHVGKPRCEFIGRAELATAFRDWTPLESEACPDGRPGGVLLAHVEEWPRAVPLDAAIRRIDPRASNPYVQANAAGFRSGAVLITGEEYAAVVALSHVARKP
jgi:hypothetical protein